MTEAANAAQAEFWNVGPGQTWVRRQTDLDALLGGVTDLLLAAAAPRPGEAALDVGCGAGASTFALAAAVGPAGRVTGLDISAPLLARAEARRAEFGLGLGDVGFLLADAQDHPFPPQGFDLVASRFGLMFFADPVAAFANMRRGLRPGGRIVFAAWAGPERNPWFALPQGVAAARLGAEAPADPDGPGPMAFRDLDRVRGLLAAAGFTAVDAALAQTELHHPGGVAAVVDLASEVGPTARLLRERAAGEADRQAIAEDLAAALQPFRSPDGVRIPAGINLVSARAP